MARLSRQPTFTFLALALACGTIDAREDSEQHEMLHATVVTPGAAVRSGPGDSYYLTETLPQDSAVEVYRRQPDGWCAIRPTAESFSWVYSPHVRLLGEELAEINKNDVAARVGSRLSSQRDVVQVRLEKGEVVQIVGQDERDGHAWYKIAPPAGEFRWIHAKDLAIDGAPPVEIVEIDDVRPASHEVSATGSNSDQWTAVAAPPLAPISPTSSPAPARSAAPSADITPVAPVASSADLAQQLTILELQLSRMVAEPMTTWSIEPLERTAEQLLSGADTVADREAVKSTLAKIDRFAVLHRRSASMSGPLPGNSSLVNNGTPAVSGVAGATPMIQGQVVAPMANGDSSAASPHDAVGVLRPVVSSRPGAPQFALVDDQGQVVTFVTASPDVNLQPYLGRRIGVAGSRGYIPEFRRPHVTAGRVTPLNERVLR